MSSSTPRHSSSVCHVDVNVSREAILRVTSPTYPATGAVEQRRSGEDDFGDTGC